MKKSRRHRRQEGTPDGTSGYNPKTKLAEAEYFLSHMVSEQHNPASFDYELSAFLTAARSVLQYAHASAEASPVARGWYDTAVRSDEVIKFFKEKRDISIHREPIRPARDANVSISSGVVAFAELGIAVIRKSGAVEHVDVPRRKRPTPPRKRPPTVTYRHRFSDWGGSEDVLALAQRYVDALRGIIDDGFE